MLGAMHKKIGSFHPNVLLSLWMETNKNGSFIETQFVEFKRPIQVLRGVQIGVSINMLMLRFGSKSIICRFTTCLKML